MRTKHSRHAHEVLLLALCALSASAAERAAASAQDDSLPRHTFFLDGGFFYGPGPIVPDTQLPHGRLANIRFDSKSLSGYCEFANDGERHGLLSDGRTRINQNIDAGRLLIGGGVSPILLTAVDGGPHDGTERYYLDEQYRFVWRVDIALDPGFAEGIIRLDDFVLNTGVVRIGRSLQSARGEPGGYDQAGSLPAGAYLAGRVGDFNEDGYLDGVLVAAPHVPLAADMLPGAPVGNRRGFRTDVHIAAAAGAELMLRGAMHLREPIDTTLDERDRDAARVLILDLEERLRIVKSSATRAAAQKDWIADGAARRLFRELAQLHDAALALAGELGNRVPEDEMKETTRALFKHLAGAIEDIAALNTKSGKGLRALSAQLEPQSAPQGLRQKNY